jgi:hypothetical protein
MVDQLGIDVPLPSYVPERYAVADAATVTDPEGGRWLLMVYTDGVEPLFVLHGLPQRTGAPVGPVSPGGPSVQAQAAPVGLDQPAGDQLTGFRAGRFAVVQGRIGGRTLAAVGSVEPVQLQLVLESVVE